jgi:hypothetical protein
VTKRPGELSMVPVGLLQMSGEVCTRTNTESLKFDQRTIRSPKCCNTSIKPWNLVGVKPAGKVLVMLRVQISPLTKSDSPASNANRSIAASRPSSHRWPRKSRRGLSPSKTARSSSGDLSKPSRSFW